MSSHQHIRLPISLAPDKTFTTLHEDSRAEIVQNVAQVLRTRIGERLATPDFGTPDPTFAGFDVAVALDLVRAVEDRADLELVEAVLTGKGVQTVEIDLSRQES